MEHAIELSVARTCSNPRRMQPTPTYAEWIMFFLRMLTMQHHSSVTFTENSNNGARNFQSRNMFRHVFFCKTDFSLVPFLYMKEWLWSAIPFYRQLTWPWYIEVPEFCGPTCRHRGLKKKKNARTGSHQEYILDLHAGQLHRKRLKEVRHTFWIKTLSVHVPARASE